MAVVEKQDRYKAQELLNESVQPWPDLEGEAFTALCNDIKKNGIRQPISLSGDEGIMFDGNQRCRAWIEIGKVWIPGDKVQIDRKVNKRNIWDVASAVNNLRRHHGPEVVADHIRRCYARGLSQKHIAKAAGVSQAYISKIAKKFNITPPGLVTGLDGKQYPSEQAEGTEKRGRKTAPVWSYPSGRGYKAAVALAQALKEEPIIHLSPAVREGDSWRDRHDKALFTTLNDIHDDIADQLELEAEIELDLEDDPS